MPPLKTYENNATRQSAYRRRNEEARRLERERKGLPDLPPIPTIPGERRWAAMIREATALLNTVLQERETYFDDRSETWRDSEKGDDFQERTDAIQEVLDALEAIDIA